MATTTPKTAAETPTTAQIGPWDAEILTIAATYKDYGVLAENPHWGPTACAAPTPPPSPETPRLSSADSRSGHGEKLYYLYAKNRAGYVRTGNANGPVEVGQVIVKEAFVPVELAQETPPPDPKKVARKGSRAFVPGDRMALFVMKKVGRGTPDTDDGWIYAVTDAKGQQVTASGKIDSCVSCHERAPHDRLFAKDL